MRFVAILGIGVVLPMRFGAYHAGMSDGIFASDSVFHRITREGLILLAGGAATILQTSHPAVAQGVQQHSDFAADPVRRLRHTLEWIYVATFGTRAEATRISDAVHAMHERVSGSGYRANDPHLQVWVSATLQANALLLYQRAFGPLSAAEREEYHRANKIMAELIGCPPNGHPDTYADFRDYYRRMIDDLEITDVCREIAYHVLHPKVAWPLRPALGVFRLVTIGLLPERLREQYGWRWTPAREMAFRAILRAVVLCYPWLPTRIRTLPRDLTLRDTRRRLDRRRPLNRSGG
jgi:uncharacterized protein (DUF2236 family)